MKTLSITTSFLVALTASAPMKSFAQCDQFVGNILSKHLRPVIETADCPVAKYAGLDKKRHRLVGVCYQSSGPTSHIRIDTHLNCYGSDKSVVSHLGRLVGVKNPPSVSENVTVEAEVSGSDCHLNYAKVKPSGELGKVIASLFDANGEARKALEQGLTEVCNR